MVPFLMELSPPSLFFIPNQQGQSRTHCDITLPTSNLWRMIWEREREGVMLQAL